MNQRPKPTPAARHPEPGKADGYGELALHGAGPDQHAHPLAVLA